VDGNEENVKNVELYKDRLLHAEADANLPLPFVIIMQPKN